ncbi:MAG: hypothetical protein KAQ64_02625 [Candidatus Pacebacteria bacterium]|nr:hypothetical protein [Candidatus Paceibacterota bacterium]
MNYKHTQIGYLVIFALLGTILLFGTILMQEDLNYPILVFMILILLLLSSFVTLQVTLDERYLKIKFGYGIYRKSFLLQEIISVKTVRNHWYYGWGIRVWFWPYMLIYNISGFDAVEIRMKNNKIYRIGTDEPKKLEQAITQAIR